MKRNLRLALAACLAGVFMLGASSVFAVDTKISAEVWARYNAQLQPDKSTAEATNVLKQNGFSIQRGYVTLNPKFNDEMAFRFTFDLHDVSSLYLKYAYFQYTLPTMPDLTMYAGLIKTYFGTLDSWSYVTIDKDLSDIAGVSSADQGVSAYYYLPSGLGNCAFEIMNGEGYKKKSSYNTTNVHPAYVANLSLTPMAGLTVGGAVKYQYEGSLGKEIQKTFYNANLKYVMGPSELWLQYVSIEAQKDHAVDSYLLSAYYMGMFVFNMKSVEGLPPMELILRGDFKDPKAGTVTYDSTTRATIVATIGMNYNITKGVTFQLNYTREMPESLLSVDTPENSYKISDKLAAQLKISFSAKAK